MLRLASTYYQINIVALLLNRGGLSGNQIQSEIAYLEDLEEPLKSAESSLTYGDTESNGLRQKILRDLEVLKAELELLKAEKGDAQAQDKLGNTFLVGSLGVAKDEAEAVRWFRKAAEQNHAEAENSLGSCYACGQGVAKDEVEAAKWYRKAAERGNAHAQCNLGVSYDTGQGVAKDEVEALKWYRKAAEQGNAVAQCNLGVSYGTGQGVAKDEAEAVKWFRKAAEQNLASAQFSLGFCYYTGRGVAKNEVEAVQWYRKAAESENVRALNGLAWVLATSENSAIRDGSKAVVFAEKAVSVAEMFPKEYEKHLYLDTLAAAYAEAGQFEKAVRTEQEAIGLLQTEAYKTDYKARLKLFEAKSSYRAKD
jgi:TPR repeat protein